MSSLADLWADSNPGQEWSPEKLAALSEKTPCGREEKTEWYEGEIETHLTFYLETPGFLPDPSPVLSPGCRLLEHYLLLLSPSVLRLTKTHRGNGWMGG